jgi:hypothetical protein
MIGNALTRVREPTTSWVHDQRHLINPSRLAAGHRAPHMIIRQGGMGEILPLPVNSAALMVPGATTSIARYGVAGAAVVGAIIGLLFGEEGHRFKTISLAALGGASVGWILAGLALKSSALTDLLVYVRQKGAT